MFTLFRREEKRDSWLLEPVAYARGVKENFSGKIILPQLCLVDLVQKQVETPYVFKISTHGGISYTHSGVLDFTAEPGIAVLPKWMHEQLSIDGTVPVEIECASAPRGEFIKLLPQQKEFLDVENPKAELEAALRNYQVLSHGDTIELALEGEFKTMMFTVVGIRPVGEVISIIDTDLEVEFLPPADYKEESESARLFIEEKEVGGIKILKMKQCGLCFSAP
jgi:ubiquitin fusion degradation protein 1